MVSTRSVKYKFSEGEKVLCYEPDPAKTKVLYNSKVLDVRVKKDSSGRKVAHFLIHFQGWNSTWDRFVTEDYILKDTEENRKLQRELAEKAQLTAGCGNLYRRERKKRGRVKLSGQASDRQGGCGGWSDGDTSLHNGSGNYSGGSCGSGGHGNNYSVTGTGIAASGGINFSTLAGGKRHHPSDSDGSDDDFSSRAVHFIVSPTLMSTLNNDHALITEKSKVVNLPGVPTAVEVLEMWMREYTLSQVRLMCHNCQKRGHLRPSAGRPPNTITIDNFCTSANLCREVADGLRIFLDFTIGTILLYEEERRQYEVFFVGGLAKDFLKNEPLDGNSKENEENVHEDGESKYIIGGIRDQGDRRKSLRSHITRQVRPDGQAEEPPGQPAEPQAAATRPRPLLGVASQTTQQQQQPRCNGRTDSRAPSAELPHGAIDLASLFGPDANKGGEQLVLRPMSLKERELLKKVVSRRLLPEKYNSSGNPLPSQVYGAIHLARALVKIPSMLATSDLNDLKMDLLIDYLTNFMKFLEEHPEWFSEDNYRDNIYSDVLPGSVKQECDS
uniref:Protein male-specific lethal-3 n=1 Tax=Panstrongylus lignarius TaxID=156445 RepID=A0A224XHK4_9HEMI